MAEPTALDSLTDAFAKSSIASAATSLSILSKRGNAGAVYMCHSLNWAKICHYDVHSLGDCVTLPNGYLGDEFSFGPDPGAKCWLFK